MKIKETVMKFLNRALCGILPKVHKKKSNQNIGAENIEPSDDLKESEKAKALERILLDLEDMYRDREEIVPGETNEEEVPAPGEGVKSKNNLEGKITAIVSIIAFITCLIIGYSDRTIYETLCEVNSIEEAEVLTKTADAQSIKEPVATERVEEYDDIPELIAKADEQPTYSDEDIYLLAQLIFNESGNQVREGQIAVAEVVANRLNSDLFPNTVEEVLFQPGQFASKSALKKRKPTEDNIEIAREVLNGDLRVLNNKDVFFFRNPMITSGISPGDNVDWGRYKYFCAIGDHAFYLKS